MDNRYCNFVRPSSTTSIISTQSSLSGEEARTFYLEEIKKASSSTHFKSCTKFEEKPQHNNNRNPILDVSRKHLFMCVQNNDIEMMCRILDNCPNMLHITDEFGWSLLMIACQANSVDITKELIARGIDISLRDKAGNSARSLVIKNKNLVLADILLSCKSSNDAKQNATNNISIKSSAIKRYFCKICNKDFPDQDEHLSSTVHNISVSKDKKIPTKFAIQKSNKGYQLMLKVGWDNESGLGPDGAGKKYPIKTVQKLDKKGLGLDKRKRKQEDIKETVKHVNRKLMDRNFQSSKNMEIYFRRQFY